MPNRSVIPHITNSALGGERSLSTVPLPRENGPPKLHKNRRCANRPLGRARANATRLNVQNERTPSPSLGPLGTWHRIRATPPTEERAGRGVQWHTGGATGGREKSERLSICIFSAKNDSVFSPPLRGSSYSHIKLKKTRKL